MYKWVWASFLIVILVTIGLWVTKGAESAILLLSGYGLVFFFLVYFMFPKSKKQ
ncbi:hypothetical protein [Rossellomorea marisflavi]|uniref:hypothetical protein n=1 Tax=Rossellomorea TaxID=2837508 RepID=UPI000A81F970|nr:hypothetical protein [Rossellomorea marisflavi]MCM2588518.1 hypothetical protein [Rossellomorea marisflavi]MCM2605325.1 hypothetical protein [Rossellomorea marisflavi]QHA35609.1 hypothetical protein D5E69_07045 [Rossellomorea marisflavi]USK93515.1 hypothetical protein LIT29_07135 [Rossellomorea marisflavi]UTE71663.1 hypothetical protein M1I95_15505 [Rossellomorea marisflavi]